MTSSSWYRNAYSNLKGTKEYSRAGYETASVRFNPLDVDVDCGGRHVMITGANKGIGLSIALILAKKGAVLHLVCRNMDNAKKTRSNIITETGNDRIHLHHLDLSRPRDVIKFCEEYSTKYKQLHVLINNAAGMREERTVDDDDIECIFAVNTLASHLLTVGLMPLLVENEDSRVIAVSSCEMLKVRLDVEDLMFETMEPFDPNLAYSQTKRQMTVLTLIYAQLFPNVQFSSMHPGLVDTEGLKAALPELYETMKDRLRTPDEGADTVVWLAVAKRARAYHSGLFFQDREAVSTHLPLAWTRHAVSEEKILLEKLQEMSLRLQQPQQPKENELQETILGNVVNPIQEEQSHTTHEDGLRNNGEPNLGNGVNPIQEEQSHTTHEDDLRYNGEPNLGNGVKPIQEEQSHTTLDDELRNSDETIQENWVEPIQDEDLHATEENDLRNNGATIQENCVKPIQEEQSHTTLDDELRNSGETIQENGVKLIQEENNSREEAKQNDFEGTRESEVLQIQRESMQVCNEIDDLQTETQTEFTVENDGIHQQSEHFDNTENAVCGNENETEVSAHHSQEIIEPSILSDSENVYDEVKESIGIDHQSIPEKNSPDSSLSSITNNLESTKVEESSKESTVS